MTPAQRKEAGDRSWGQDKPVEPTPPQAFVPIWPDGPLEHHMLRDAWLLSQAGTGHGLLCDIDVHIKALLSRVHDCQKEIERLRAGLGMISQLLSHRVPCLLAQATLDGANLLDEDVAIDVCEGHWRKP